MDETVFRSMEELESSNIPALKKRYRELFGEESKSSNKQFLFRRIAFRLQANAEGDLSERARRRAGEIADDRESPGSSAERIRGSAGVRYRQHRSQRTAQGLPGASSGLAAHAPPWRSTDCSQSARRRVRV